MEKIAGLDQYLEAESEQSDCGHLHCKKIWVENSYTAFLSYKQDYGYYYVSISRNSNFVDYLCLKT